MKETIKYFYNVYPLRVYDIDNGCYFFINDYKYYFVKFYRDISSLDLLVEISNDLYNKNILVDTFILSKDNKFYVKVDDDIYVMLRVNGFEDDIYSLKDVVHFNNLYVSDNKVGGNWSLLWERKIDSFEQEVSEINNEYPLIQESFSYYVGMAENAISYFKDTISDEDMSSVKVNLNHKRIDSLAMSANICNPLTFIIDYEVRDVSEYIKSKFFLGILDFDEVDDILLSNNFSRASLRILFARLLYPSYYFDAVRNVFIYDESDEVLRKFIDKCDMYEDFLIDVYNLINKRYNIPPVEWLVNKG